MIDSGLEASVNAQEAWPTAFPGGPACFESSVWGVGCPRIIRLLVSGGKAMVPSWRVKKMLDSDSLRVGA